MGNGFSPEFLSDSKFRIPKDKPQKNSFINQQDDASLVLTLGQSSNSCISISPNNMNDLEGTVRQKGFFGNISKPELNLDLSLSTTSYAEAEPSQELSSFPKSVSSPFVGDKKFIDEDTKSSIWIFVPPDHVDTGMDTIHTDKTPVNQELSSLFNTYGSPAIVNNKQFINGDCSSSKGNIGPLAPPDHAYIVVDKSHGNQELALSSHFDKYGVTHEKARKKAAVKSCQFGGCPTRARGATGLCIRHGGGKRCQKVGCEKSAEGKTVFCIAHGGGPRCKFTGCNKGAQGRTMLCKAHGGGKRCTCSGCNRSAAEGKTQLCKGHGGGKRCTHKDGCTKSVHGGTLFCVRHGGGKRCDTAGCTKSARGSTNHCVRHGGGKRCVKCGKSVQGGTKFCNAHGGGKRCSWGGGPCEKFARGRSGLCFAHNAQVGSASGVQYLQASQSQQTELECRVHGGNYFQNANFGNN